MIFSKYKVRTLNTFQSKEPLIPDFQAETNVNLEMELAAFQEIFFLSTVNQLAKESDFWPHIPIFQVLYKQIQDRKSALF